jgi:hypothetical protein
MSDGNPPPVNDPPPPDSDGRRAAGDGPPPARSRVTGRTLYDAIMDDVLPLILNPRTGIPILALIALIVALLFVIKYQGLYYESAWFRVGPSPSPQTMDSAVNPEPQTAELKQCFAKGRELKKPYVIEAIAYLIQYDTDVVNNHPVIRDNRRLIYTIRALRKINLDEELFAEEIDSHIPGHTVARSFGNEDEAPGHDPNLLGTFDVKFAMNEGDVRNIVTGANFTLPLPLPTRSEFSGQLLVPPNQNFEGYGNTLDVICELDIVVESRTLPIVPVGDAAKRFFENTLRNEKARLNYDVGGAPVPRTISARWKNVMPGERVGIHFGWPQQQPPQ